MAAVPQAAASAPRFSGPAPARFSWRDNARGRQFVGVQRLRYSSESFAHRETERPRFERVKVKIGNAVGRFSRQPIGVEILRRIIPGTEHIENIEPGLQ